MYEARDIRGDFHECTVVCCVGHCPIDDVAAMNLDSWCWLLSRSFFTLCTMIVGGCLGITVAIDLLQIGAAHLVDADDLNGNFVARANDVLHVINEARS